MNQRQREALARVAEILLRAIERRQRDGGNGTPITNDTGSQSAHQVAYTSLQSGKQPLDTALTRIDGSAAQCKEQ